MYHQPHNSKGNFNFNAFRYTSAGYQDHFHRNFELIYIMEGAVPVRLGQEEYLLEKGEMLFIPPWESHSFAVDAKSCAWVGVFSKDYISKFAHREEGRQFLPFRCEPATEQFLKEHLFRGEPPLYLLIACFNLICDQMIRFATPRETKEESTLRNQILLFIGNHYTEPISLARAAEELGYEYHYFSQLFNRCFGMNFRAFINIYRFDLACEMLSETDQEIIEIAMESGFQSLRNFNRIFKSLSGSTPQEYRSAAKAVPKIPYRKD